MTMNKVIAVTLGTVIIFTAAVMWFNFIDKQVQDGLITAFFSLFGAELAMMGGIKITKVRCERKAIRESIRRGTFNRERRYEAWDNDEYDTEDQLEDKIQQP